VRSCLALARLRRFVSISRFNFVSLLLLAVGCQSGASLGTQCTSASACGAPLVCRLGRCRNECTENRDCPLGAQCFLDTAGLGACQLEVDRSCGEGSCGSGLTCLASECVRACGGAAECPTDGECTIASGATVGVCSDLRDASDAGGTTDDAGGTTNDAGVVPEDAATVDGGGACGQLDALHVCAGVGFACAIRTNHTVVCWGVSSAGEIGFVPTTLCDGVPCATRPIAVSLYEGGPLMGAEQIGCGDDFACALLDTTRVRCWGRNYALQLSSVGDALPDAHEVVDVGGLPLEGATALALGTTHACVLAGPDAAYCWGDNLVSELGRDTASMPSYETATPALVGMSVRGLFGMSGNTCVARADGSLWCLGDNSHAQLGAATPAASISLLQIPSLTLDATNPVMAGGSAMGCALDSTHHVRCWGRNDREALGQNLGSPDAVPTPALLYGPARTVAFDALVGGVTTLTTCGVSGTDLWCWGDNGAGQAALDPALVDVAPATRVMGLPPVREGACAQQQCCAVDTNHRLWCWGANAWGQLGRGTLSTREFVPGPVCVP
jgi:alpha-tubulin suppressor-like RCC1 family protein